MERRVEVLENRLSYENNPEAFFSEYEPKQEALRQQIAAAQECLPRVTYSRAMMERIAKICIALDVDGHRADIVMLKTAVTLAAYHGKEQVEKEEILQAARLALPHRMRRKPFEDTAFDLREISRTA